jgi:hypothetical protein
MNEMYKIPLDWFRQIYVKNGKRIRFADKINRKLFMELALNQPDNVVRALNCCFFLIKKDDGDLIKTITVRLDFDDEICRKLITSNKNLFYKSVNTLVEFGILYKLNPKVYIVSMEYICVMTLSQRSLFHSSSYSRMNVIDISNVPTRQPLE